MILGWGLTLAVPGDTLASFPAYALLSARASENAWAAMLIAVGLLRIAALIVNGRMRRGSPIARCVASAIGAMIWSQFFASFLDYSIKVGAPSGGLSVYLVLFAADIFSCGRAAWDATVRWR
jgi:hypothetical protein